jgi:DNA (cytosine-5)-methyltransferase 1
MNEEFGKYQKNLYTFAGMNFIDLFAGAGGLSEGFKKAGFNPVAHVEYDQAACFTLKTRAAYHFLSENNRVQEYYSYLKGETSRQQLYDKIPSFILDSVINAEIGKDNPTIFKKIDTLKGNKEIDVIIGGPPCQAYSYIGRAALKNRVNNDNRNYLYKGYGKFLKRYKPKLFVFENVPGIKTAGEGLYFKNLTKYFKQIGYCLDDTLVNAWDFEVVQKRERVLIIGWRKDLEFKFPEFEKHNHDWNRSDIFDDLAPIQAAHYDRISKYVTEKPNDYLSKTGIRNGVNFVTQHITRPHNKKDLSIYRMAITKLEKEGKRLKNDEIPEGKRTQNNVTDFLDRFKVVGKEPHTMIAHIAKDGHHFIHHKPEQLRSISVREAARIQSFPDDFYFEGVKETQPRTPAFKQIGNAVPPLMAKFIATKISKFLNEQASKS